MAEVLPEAAIEGTSGETTDLVGREDAKLRNILRSVALNPSSTAFGAT
jgi:hypothetical protein